MNISAFHYFFESPNCLLIGGLFWLAMSAKAQGLTLTAGRGGWGGGGSTSLHLLSISVPLGKFPGLASSSFLEHFV